MAPVAGRPFLAHQMDHWIAQGIDRFVLSVGYRAVAISNHFGDRYRGVPIDYVVEPSPLGTGGALVLAAAKLRSSEPALLLNGDTYFDVDLSALAAHAERHDADWCLALFRHDDAARYMGVALSADGRITALRASRRAARQRRRLLVSPRGARRRRARARPGRVARRRHPAAAASTRASASPASSRTATSSTSACRTTTCAPPRCCRRDPCHRRPAMPSTVERMRRRTSTPRSAAKQQLLGDTATMTLFARAVDASIARYRDGGRLYIAGNGGSAADAQHLAAEFVSRLARDRAPLPAEALTTDSSILTAIGNDYGFEHVFSRQLAGKATGKDVFLAITTSGRSPNILKALEQCRASAHPEHRLHRRHGRLGQGARRLLHRRPGRDDERDPGAAHPARAHLVRMRRVGAVRRRLTRSTELPRP